jgi:cytochrome c
MKLAVASLTTAALAFAGTANAALDKAAAEAMMKKDGCSACHAIDKKVVGPAYVDVAAKYKGDAGAAAKLEAKVKAGGSGVWGPVPMPPNSAVPEADIKALVGWILTLKK